MDEMTREQTIAVLHRHGLLSDSDVAYHARRAAEGRRQTAPNVSVYAVARRLAAMEAVVEAARAVSGWDWQHLLVDHPDSEVVRADAKRLDAALARIAEGGK